MVSLILFIFLCVLYVYFLLKSKYSYWSRMGVKNPKPLPIVGNFGKLMFMQQSVDELMRSTYVQYPQEKIVGLYCGFRKVAVLRDPAVIRHVLAKDFKYFPNRGVRTTEDGFCNNLLVSEGEIWRSIRQKLTPAFSSTKIKHMIPLIQECVDKFMSKAEIQAGLGSLCDIKDLCDKYSLDLISSCVFGLGLDVYSNEVKHFRKIAQIATKPTITFWLWYVAEMILPGIQCKFTVVSPGSYLRKFFTQIVTTIIHERETRGIKRNDMMNIMIELKSQDKLKIDDSSTFIMDDNTIASQAFAFYIAGQDTSSSALSFLLYELSLHPEIQETVYKEVCSVFDKYNGKLTYDAVKEMSYLQMAYREAMRTHPAIGFIMRKCSSDYTIPETEITLESGTFVFISLTALHGDSTYFPNPEIFNPENCSEENLRKIPQYAYLPFGAGPRNCIGYRLAEMHVLLATASFLRDFRMSPCTDAQLQVKYNKSSSITLAPIGGLWVNIAKR